MREVLREAFALNVARLAPRSALPRAVGVVAAVTLGLLVAQPDEAALMAIGAWVAGLADLGGPRRKAVLFVVATSLAVALGAVLGRVTAFSDPVAIAVLGLWSACLASLARFDRPGSELGLLAIYGFVLSTTGFTDITGAFAHAKLLLAGGAIQLALMFVPGSLRSDLSFEPLVLYSSIRRHALRIAIAMMTAFAVTTMPVFGEHSYWVATAALFILRPGVAEIVPSILARFLGTALAVAIGTLLLVQLQPSQPVLVAIAGVAGYCTYLVFSAGFAMFTAASGALLITLSAVIGLPAADTTRDLAFDTLWGAVIALVAYVLVPRPTGRPASDST